MLPLFALVVLQGFGHVQQLDLLSKSIVTVNPYSHLKGRSSLFSPFTTNLGDIRSVQVLTLVVFSRQKGSLLPSPCSRLEVGGSFRGTFYFGPKCSSIIANWLSSFCFTILPGPTPSPPASPPVLQVAKERNVKREVTGQEVICPRKEIDIYIYI